MKPTGIGAGGLGDLVVSLPRNFSIFDYTKSMADDDIAPVTSNDMERVTNSETLRNYHQDGEKILMSCDVAMAAAWRNYAKSLASQIGK